jgi:hypothetical protein
MMMMNVPSTVVIMLLAVYIRLRVVMIMMYAPMITALD